METLSEKMSHSLSDEPLEVVPLGELYDWLIVELEQYVFGPVPTMTTKLNAMRQGERLLKTMGELYRRGIPITVPWYDYDRICCVKCTKEFERQERRTKEMRCCYCAKELMSEEESMIYHDQISALHFWDNLVSLRKEISEKYRVLLRIRKKGY